MSEFVNEKKLSNDIGAFELGTGSFRFGTKAETLEALRNKVKSATMLDHIKFTINQWNEKRDEILKKIQAKLNSKHIAVRSSCLEEDSQLSSSAGAYKSILNIKLENSEEIICAVEQVIKSYGKNDRKHNNYDQILIQPQIEDVEISGVMFTVDVDTGSPYILINYDDTTGKTDTVTSGYGQNLKVFTYFKYLDILPSNKDLAKLILLAKELEEITNNNAIDIEFVIKQNEIFLLQVRQITTKFQNKTKVEEKEIIEELNNIKRFFSKINIPQSNLHGFRTIYGYMPDWNPAEMIGITPKPLAFSLYRELITDEIWPLSRRLVGYKNIGYFPGIHSLAGKAYVDVRMSFNTFLPHNLPEDVSEKLINFYIDKLIANPELHDKIEFDIAYTSYDFFFEEKEKEMLQNNFSKKQIDEIKKCLLELTDNIVNERVTTISEEMEHTYSLNEKREKTIKSYAPADVKIKQLLHDCKYYGTLPFSKLARFAFISNILLKSLIKKNVITHEEYQKIFGSIRTIAYEFIEDLTKLKERLIQKKDFINKYGHLRPGSYDICSRTYKEGFEEYINIKNFKGSTMDYSNFDISDETKRRIDQIIKECGFTFTAEQFLSFCRRAIKAREEAKYEFSKNLSLVLDYCEEYTKEYSISKDDTAFLEIEDITKSAFKSKPREHIKVLKEIINNNKKQYNITKAIRLPPLIYIERNFDYFHLFDNKPNYVTNKNEIGEVVYVDANYRNQVDLNNKIVLIENADPGYDWIFSHNIKGLITKYGGPGSHMCIRATEFNLPAVIGCGGAIFDLIKSSKIIEMNCATNQIKRVI